MLTTLPAPLDAYVQAKNAHDTDALLACFADDAIVHDEGQDIQGLAAIRAWSDHTIEAYKVTMDVTDVVEQGNDVLVTAMISGTFEGSPVALTFRFTLRDGKIAGLRIA